MKMDKHFSRRDFIKAAGALGGIAPVLIPSHVWGAMTPPSDRLTMGFIGVGKQNRYLLSKFLARNTQVVAVCDVDTTRRESAKKIVEDYYAAKAVGGYKGCTAYTDFRKLLARKDIDGVCIASPDHWHAIHVVAAAKAKKDIYCEKPLSLTIPEARAMVNAVRKHDRVLQTGSMQRSSPEFYKACMLVRNGRIGRSNRSSWTWAPRRSGATCRKRPWSPDSTGTSGWARRRRGPTTPSSVRAEFPKAFRIGASTGNTPAAA